jgi:hypothetical protein
MYEYLIDVRSTFTPSIHDDQSNHSYNQGVTGANEAMKLLIAELQCA